MNLSESIKQRLKNIAANKGQDINSVFQYYVMERFLCRVSKSPHAQFLILKGALMLRVLGGPLFRATRDIDFQMAVPTNIDEITEIMRQCASIHIEDGVLFDPDSIKASQIQIDTDLSLEQAVTRIDKFLMPICEAISTGTTFHQIWNPGGSWEKTAGITF